MNVILVILQIPVMVKWNSYGCILLRRNEKKEEKTFDEKILKELEATEKNLTKLSNREFACEADARGEKYEKYYVLKNSAESRGEVQKRKIVETEIFSVDERIKIISEILTITEKEGKDST